MTSMTNLVVHNRMYGWYQVYYLSAIKNIEYGKASKFYNDADIRGNEMRPNDAVIIIHFKDGTDATFSGDEEITFESEV